MEPISTTISSIFLKELVTHFSKKLISLDLTSNSSQAKSLLEQLTDDDIAGRYVEKYVAKFLRMRTLHSAESDVYLDEVYTPLTLRTLSNKDKLRVEDDFTLEYSKIVNIIGIAGQGKSTILRKLFLEEIKKQNKFPFFIELRRVDEDGIIEYLKKNLEDVGLVVDSESLSELLLSNNIILLLDGFDEVSNQDRKKILNEIVKIKTRYNCSVIVTSRPDTEICHETNITNLRIDNLSLHEIIDIIKKLDKNNECNEIIDLITSNIDLQSTLVSPILVNLLFVCYPYLDIVPENVVDFYDKLFLTLFCRHDKIKNFNREKYSNISSIIASNIFEALCFNSLKNECLEFNDTSIIDNLLVSLKYSNIDIEHVDNIKQDIINITCLIQKDGFDRYVFLHKSIQEFHAAKFISKLPHEHKKKFYTNLAGIIDSDDKYDSVINFLKEIDKNDFESLFIMEHFKSFYFHEFDKANENKVITSCIAQAFYDKVVMFNVKEGDENCYNTGFSSLIYGNVLATMSLLTHGSRFHNNMVDDILLEKISITKEKKRVLFPSEFVKENCNKIVKNSGLSDDTSQVYVVSLTKCLEYSDSLDVVKNAIRILILNFYNDIYTPISTRSNQLSNILELDFDL